MAQVPSNETLSNKIDNLTKLVEDGFNGVHARQDTTNGKVIKNTEFRIVELADKESRKANWTNLKWILGFIGAGTLVSVVRILSLYL